MNRIAFYTWSISLGVIGFFLGLGVAGNTHQYENWQVGLAGFVTAVAFCVPTAFAVSYFCKPSSPKTTMVLAAVGVILPSGIQYIFWDTMLS
jgi:hypothetical protein